METKWVCFDLQELKKPSLNNKLQEALTEAGELIRRGELVAFPTETVYGLGANALSGLACRKIYQTKGRPSDNPLIVHVATMKQAREIVSEWPEQASLCAQKFWPGPLTMVLPKSKIIPSEVSGGLSTVAVRMPSHPAALALIKEAAVPIAAPSANISGKPSPTEGKYVWQDLAGKIPLLLDTGKCSVGLESTVLDLSGEIPCILRPGGITLEQLQSVLGEVLVDRGSQDSVATSSVPKAPGMKYRHYAPKGKIDILKGNIEHKLEKIAQIIKQKNNNYRIALICLEETAAALNQKKLEEIDFLYILGSLRQPREAASKLFESLRLCDDKDIDIILAEEMPEEGIGFAFMNRLQKAAGSKDKV